MFSKSEYQQRMELLQRKVSENELDAFLFQPKRASFI